MLEKLLQTLEAVGKPPIPMRMPDGSVVLVLPYGGRILGLFAPASGENFLWTHPALASVETARAFYAASEWHNSGGDRTWLAPEVDIFFPRYPDLDLTTYFQPRELDPGQYEVKRAGDCVRLENRLTLTLSRSHRSVTLVMAKWITPAPNPLRYEADFETSGQYAGYTLHTSLEILDGAGESCVGLWDLMQMPHGGDLLVATHVRAEPKIYMGSVSPEDLVAGEHLLRFRMRAPGEHKIGIRAAAVTGRAAYEYQSGGHYSLVIRNFAVNPSGEYVDVPWREPGNFGYAVQACSVNSGLGRFSELEYHSPAIGAGTGRDRCEDVSQVWAFRGSQPYLRAAAARLLTTAI